MAIRVGINGFGRIGRNFFRAIHENPKARSKSKGIEVVAVNDLGSIPTMAHLLANDSVMGKSNFKVRATKSGIKINNVDLKVLAERDPVNLPWKELGVDVVIEATGLFTSRDQAAAHLSAGAKRVIISAPGKDVDATFVVGVNDHTFRTTKHKVISNASCTTNCFVPMVKVLDDAFGVRKGFMTTIHAYTGDQSLVDGPHSDLRRARSAAVNIIPTSTGAARATGLVLQSMVGKLDGSAIRVPVPVGSLTDFTAVLSKSVEAEDINQAFRIAAKTGPLSGILEYSVDPLVSQDIVGSAASCVLDSQMTMASGTLVKVFGWYDNEWGYSNRLVDLTLKVGSVKTSR